MRYRLLFLTALRATELAFVVSLTQPRRPFSIHVRTSHVLAGARFAILDGSRLYSSGSFANIAFNGVLSAMLVPALLRRTDPFGIRCRLTWRIPPR